MFKLMLRSLFILLLFVGSADASATYTLQDQRYGGESVERGATLALSLTISDLAIQQGAFNLSEVVSSPGTNYATGDVSDFIELSWAVGTTDSGYLTPTSGAYTTLSTSLTFADGIPTGTIHLTGETSEFALTGEFGLFTGTLASDNNNCNDPHGMSRCSVAGQLSDHSTISEPAAATILASALFYLWLGRHHLRFG